MDLERGGLGASVSVVVDAVVGGRGAFSGIAVAVEAREVPVVVPAEGFCGCDMVDSGASARGAVVGGCVGAVPAASWMRVSVGVSTEVVD